MNTNIIHKLKNRLTLQIIIFSLQASIIGFASVAGAVYSLPADRSIDWYGNVGVLSDIPARTSVFTTLKPSGGNDTTAIQTAITNCPAGQVVQLAAGTFTVSSSIKMKSGVTIRGAGMGITIVKGASGMGGNNLIGTSGYSQGSSVSIVAGLNKGSSIITTSTAHGFAAGDIILIDQLNNASADPVVTNIGGGGTCTWCGRTSGTRSLGQVVKVASVSSATVAKLEIPLYWNYDLTLNPQATKFNGITQEAGIEDITIDNSLSGNASQSGDNATISFIGVSNCWLLRVEAIGSWQNMVLLKAAYRNTVRGSKFHEGVPPTPVTGSQYSGRAYGVRMTPYASANLIENNQLWHLGMAVVMNGAVSGNAIAYNYIDILYDPSSNWNKAAIAFHGAHPIMNLMEGNYSSGRLMGDWYWGSASHNTYFRNRENILTGKTGGTWNCDIQKNNLYYNFIGNVFGTIGIESTYELNNIDLSGKKAIYRFGYTGDGDGGASGNDPRVYATTLRHGNWDSATTRTTWNGSDDKILPTSLYLNSKPGWWGSIQWPAIGPDISPMYPATGPIGEGTPWEGKTSLSPPTKLRIK